MKRLLVTAALLLIASSAYAQLGGGTLSGMVTDEQGAVLPGVAVTIAGSDRTRHGGLRRSRQVPLPELAPGIYKVTTSLAGFAPTSATTSCSTSARPSTCRSR